MSATATPKAPPPKDALVRAARPGLEVRAAGEGSMPTLHGYLLRFNEWTEIDSLFEGRFLERIVPSAAKKTLRENAESVKILFNHGHDPSIGEKTLAPPTLSEDREGVHYEGELFDTSYNRDLIPGLEAGQYGASFKFRVIKETWDEEPGTSDHNPDGIPERTIEELRLYEGGPVTFPAYEGASAGVRSMTDQVFFDRLRQDPSRMPALADLFAEWVRSDPERAEELIAEAKDDDRSPGVEAEAAADETSREIDKETSEEEPPPEALPNDATEGTEPSDDALPDGAETSHSDAGSRSAPWRADHAKTTPPWRREPTRKSPWRSEEESKK